MSSINDMPLEAVAYKYSVALDNCIMSLSDWSHSKRVKDHQMEIIKKNDLFDAIAEETMWRSELAARIGYDAGMLVEREVLARNRINKELEIPE